MSCEVVDVKKTPFSRYFLVAAVVVAAVVADVYIEHPTPSHFPLLLQWNHQQVAKMVQRVNMVSVIR